LDLVSNIAYAKRVAESSMMLLLHNFGVVCGSEWGRCIWWTPIQTSVCFTYA